MLKLTDLGCDKHKSYDVVLNGLEATIVQDILYNLPREGECRTYICEQGQTHHLCMGGKMAESR